MPAEPYAPTPVYPVDGASINVADTHRFDWIFSDPNPGDVQTKYDLHWRSEADAGVWTEINAQVSANTYHDFAASFFTVDEVHEWRVRVYDSTDLVSPWSSIELFEPKTGPADPVITDPVAAATITTPTYAMVWTAAAQEGYQVRKLGDDAGAPDEDLVYYDSGLVETGIKNHLFSFSTNRIEHLQVRVQVAGLWSGWDSVQITVDYEAVPQPSLTATVVPVDPHIEIDIVNPAPTGGQPALSHTNLYRDGLLIVVFPSGSTHHNDYTAVPGTVHTYQAVAVGVDGSENASVEVDADVLVVKGTWIHAVDDPEGTLHQFIYNDNGGDDDWEAEHAELHFAGRTGRMMEYGSEERRSITINFALEDDRGDYEALKAFAESKSLLQLRDFRGRSMLTSLPRLSRTPNRWGSRCQVTFVELEQADGPLDGD